MSFWQRVRYWRRDKQKFTHQQMIERMRELGIGVMKNKKFVLNFGQREKAFREGDALVSHVEACHNGIFEPECPACQELLKKIDDEAEEKQC